MLRFPCGSPGTPFDVCLDGRADSPGCVTQAGAGIAASRVQHHRFRAAIFVFTGGLAMPRLVSRIAVPIALVVLLAGCAARRPSVAELKYNPGRYHDKTIAVEGVVTSSWGLPLVPFRFYKVDDGTGEVTVVAQGGRVPTKGARVRVKGRVNEVAAFGGHSLGLHLQQSDLDFKGR
jgi:hypothetical protein